MRAFEPANLSLVSGATSLSQSGTALTGDLALTPSGTTNTTHYPLVGSIVGTTLTLELGAAGDSRSPYKYVAPVTRVNGGLLTQRPFVSEVDGVTQFGAGIFVRP